MGPKATEGTRTKFHRPTTWCNAQSGNMLEPRGEVRISVWRSLLKIPPRCARPRNGTGATPPRVSDRETPNVSRPRPCFTLVFHVTPPPPMFHVHVPRHPAPRPLVGGIDRHPIGVV